MNLAIANKSTGGTLSASEFNLMLEAIKGSPYFYNVRNYGAKADGKVVSGVSVTAGSATLTATGASFIQEDVGKVILIRNAGASFRHLDRIITAVVSPTQITLSAAVTTTANNTYATYGTDDTAAWQAAVDACYSGWGGIVFGESGIYMISGDLKRTYALYPDGHYNCQICLPALNKDHRMVSIKLQGAVAPPSGYPYEVQPHTSGTILQSTLTQTTPTYVTHGPGYQPSIIGVGDYVTGGLVGMSNVLVTVEDMTIRGVNCPTLTGLQLEYAGSSCVRRVNIDVDARIVDLLEPTTQYNYGLRISQKGSFCTNTLEDVWILGYGTGFRAGECAHVQSMFCFSCKVAVELPAVDYPTHFDKMVVSWCQKGFVWNGAHAVQIASYQTEHRAIIDDKQWMNLWRDFSDDIGGYASGRINFFKTGASLGHIDDFVIHNCDNVIFNPVAVTQQTKTLATDTALTNGGAWTDVPAMAVNIEGTGDWVFSVNGVLGLAGVSGTVSVKARLVNAFSGAVIDGSAFTVLSETVGGTRVIAFNREVAARIRARKTDNVTVKLQLSASWTGGSVTLHGTSGAEGASQLIKRPM